MVDQWVARKPAGSKNAGSNVGGKYLGDHTHRGDKSVIQADE